MFHTSTFMLCVISSLVLLLTILPKATHQTIIPPKSVYYSLKYWYGTYKVSFETGVRGCTLSYGYIPEENLPAFINQLYSPKFKLLSKSTSFSNQVILTTAERYYFVLVNNNTDSCYASMTETTDFSSMKPETNYYYIVPYGETGYYSCNTRAVGGATLQQFNITSESNYELAVAYSTSYSSGPFSSLTLGPRESFTTPKDTFSVTVRCDYAGNCPIKVRYLLWASGAFESSWSLLIVIGCIISFLTSV